MCISFRRILRKDITMKSLTIYLDDKILTKFLTICNDEDLTPDEWLTNAIEDYDS